MKICPTRVLLAFALSAFVAECPVPSHGGSTQDDTFTKANLTSSPRAEDRASMEAMLIPSHGAMMNALVYVAEGAGPHPAVILLHGFPGYERNLDLAQDIRRAGWNVLYFDYRGSWGTPGDFSFSHGIEDVAAVLAYLRKPENATRLRLDPMRIVLVGHSMCGFMTIQAASADPAVKGIATISATDLGGIFEKMLTEGSRSIALERMSSRLAQQAWLL